VTLPLCGLFFGTVIHFVRCVRKSWRKEEKLNYIQVKWRGRQRYRSRSFCILMRNTGQKCSRSLRFIFWTTVLQGTLAALYRISFDIQWFRVLTGQCVSAISLCASKHAAVCPPLYSINLRTVLTLDEPQLLTSTISASKLPLGSA